MFQQYKNNLYNNNNNNNINFSVHNLSINNINQSSLNISNKKKFPLKNSLSSLEIKNFNFFNNLKNNKIIIDSNKNNSQRSLSTIIQHTLYKNFKLNKTPSVNELTNPLKNLTKKIKFKKILETDSLFNIQLKRNLKHSFLNYNLNKININNNFNRSTSIEKNETFDMSYNINTNNINNSMNNNNNIKNSRNSSRTINNTSSLFLLPNITKSNSTLITTLEHKNPLKKNYKLTFLINSLIYNDFKYNQNKASIANNCIKYRKIKIFQYYQKERLKNLDKTKEKKDLFNNIKKLNDLKIKINKIFPNYFTGIKNYKNFLEQKQIFLLKNIENFIEIKFNIKKEIDKIMEKIIINQKKLKYFIEIRNFIIKVKYKIQNFENDFNLICYEQSKENFILTEFEKLNYKNFNLEVKSFIKKIKKSKKNIFNEENNNNNNNNNELINLIKTPKQIFNDEDEFINKLEEYKTNNLYSIMFNENILKDIQTLKNQLNKIKEKQKLDNENIIFNKWISEKKIELNKQKEKYSNLIQSYNSLLLTNKSNKINNENNLKTLKLTTFNDIENVKKFQLNSIIFKDKNSYYEFQFMIKKLLKFIKNFLKLNYCGYYNNIEKIYNTINNDQFKAIEISCNDFNLMKNKINIKFNNLKKLLMLYEIIVKLILKKNNEKKNLSIKNKEFINNKIEFYKKIEKNNDAKFIENLLKKEKEKNIENIKKNINKINYKNDKRKIPEKLNFDMFKKIKKENNIHNNKKNNITINVEDLEKINKINEYENFILYN